MYKRGDIYYIYKGDARTVGSEQEPGRPAIIVSNDVGNEVSPVVEVVYLTTQPKKPMPTHVLIKSCKFPSTAMCEQITTVSVERIGDWYCSCTDEEMDLVDEAMMISLGLECYYYEDETQDDYSDDVEQQEEKEEAEAVDLQQTAKLNEEIVKACAERDVYKQLYTDLLAKVMHC